MAGKQEAALREQVLAVIAEIMRDEDVRPAERLRAAEILGRRLGLFAEREETGPVIRFVWETAEAGQENS
jgi:hypothetical protein